jgi:hypothetical protein
MLQKSRTAVLTLRAAGAAGITSNVNLEQQLLGESTGGDSFPKVPLPYVPLPEAQVEVFCSFVLGLWSCLFPLF